MAEDIENKSKIASMLAIVAFHSDSRRAPVCPYCGAWGNPIQIAYDDDCAGRKLRFMAESLIIHGADNAYSRRHDLRSRYQCCQCTQLFAA
ncbi:MAG: hypothetical protein GX574_13990 [Lentisphaerae bacterium]|nr:hypothetical protein [Lentisphaerota bacterium]